MKMAKQRSGGEKPRGLTARERVKTFVRYCQLELFANLADLRKVCSRRKERR
jgi:hypothetical protein